MYSIAVLLQKTNPLNVKTEILEFRTWTVTILFTSFGIALYLAALLLPMLGISVPGSAEWTALSATTMLLSAASGLVVDLLRLLAAGILPEKLPYRLKLGKILKTNLS